MKCKIWPSLRKNVVIPPAKCEAKDRPTEIPCFIVSWYNFLHIIILTTCNHNKVNAISEKSNILIRVYDMFSLLKKTILRTSRLNPGSMSHHRLYSCGISPSLISITSQRIISPVVLALAELQYNQQRWKVQKMWTDSSFRQVTFYNIKV